MNDAEITKACAKAMGIDVRFVGEFAYLPNRGVWYEPLDDDGQAMALVKKFKLSIYQHQDLVTVSAYFYGGMRSEQHISDLNRAICDCVAKLRGAEVSAHPNHDGSSD